MIKTETTPRDEMKGAVRALLAECIFKFGSVECEESVVLIVDFCRKIYRTAREHEKEDNHDIANQN
jgi:hypothetical protein